MTRLSVVVAIAAFGFAACQPRNQEAAEQYEKVNVAELSLYLTTGIKSLTTNLDGTIVSVDAIVTGFTLAGKPVELVTDKVSVDQTDKHFATISTKHFGTIRLTLSQFGGGSVWLKPSQKKAMSAQATK
jgi:hypothetical protein